MTARMDAQQKSQFDRLCEQFGMSANTAINIFVKAVIRSKSIPFPSRQRMTTTQQLMPAPHLKAFGQQQKEERPQS